MFYTFTQNNSGGSFVRNRQVDHYVIVEADDDASSWRMANHRAERIGLYWDGCDSGQDCPCCGDRWYPQSDVEDGHKVPTVYGKPVAKISARRLQKKHEIVIHYLNGDIRYAPYKDTSTLALRDEYVDADESDVDITRQSKAEVDAKIQKMLAGTQAPVFEETTTYSLSLRLRKRR